jgi:hypothetical protein
MVQARSSDIGKIRFGDPLICQKDETRGKEPQKGRKKKTCIRRVFVKDKCGNGVYSVPMKLQRGLSD